MNSINDFINAANTNGRGARDCMVHGVANALAAGVKFSRDDVGYVLEELAACGRDGAQADVERIGKAAKAAGNVAIVEAARDAWLDARDAIAQHKAELAEAAKARANFKAHKSDGTCGRCGGSGKYFNYGVCWTCNGTGRFDK